MVQRAVLGAIGTLVLTAVGGLACSHTRAIAPRPAALRGHIARPWTLNPPAADRDAAIVRVETDGAVCTGALIAPKLVLTAHHCVAARDEQGLRLSQDLPAEQVEVGLGGGEIPWSRVTVRAILTPPCGYRAGHGDVAILVLSRPLIGMPTLRVRLDAPPAVGQSVYGVGFGNCGADDEHSRRVERRGGVVERVGVGAFFASASTCPGDSGGPAREAESGVVIGVVSASDMDENDDTPDPTFFTRLDMWGSLFSAAELLAAGGNRAELPAIHGCELEE